MRNKNPNGGKPKLRDAFTFYKLLRKWMLAGVVMCLLCGVFGVAHAENSDALLNLLIKKGMITEDEANKIKAEAENANTNAAPPKPSESKWFKGTGIKSLEMYGDVRFRYDDREAIDPVSGKIRLQRLRYQVRIGVRGEGAENFYYGVRLDTSANPRSPWVNFGSSASVSPTSIYSGPFGKSTSGLGLGHAYIGWKWGNWLDLTAGKMPNPLYTTSMVWDPDITPEGLAERFKTTVGDADLFATFGQFVYEDANPTYSTPGYFFGLNNTNSYIPFLLAWQMGFNYHVTDRISFKVAPALYNYTGRGVNLQTSMQTGLPTGGSPGFSDIYVGQGANILTGAGKLIASSGFGAFGYGSGGPFAGFTANQTGVNDLLVLEIPWEMNVKFDCVNLKLFGEYAQNLQGSQRARNAAAAAAIANSIYDPAIAAGTGVMDIVPIPAGVGHEDKAYQYGIAVGNKDSLGLVYGGDSRKHAWEARCYFQHIEQYALDPNLIDSDFFEGRENMQGFYTAFSYGFSQNAIGTVRYGYARRINNKLGTGGSNQDIPQMNPLQQYNLIQIDLAYKF